MGRNFASKNRLSVYFFGDSICFGQGVSLHKGWVSTLSREMEKYGRETDREIVVTNSAVNGRTTRKALEDMPFEIQSHRPNILIAQFGLNDCNHWKTDYGLPRVSPAAFEANMKEIVQRGLKSGADRVIVNTNHPTCRSTSRLYGTRRSYDEASHQYNQLIRQAVAGFQDKVILNDMEINFERQITRRPLSNLLLEDGLHLSAAGHRLYARALLPKLVEIASAL